MSCLIQIVALGDKLFKPGVYLKAFDHEAHNGQGEAAYTVKIEEAMRFADHPEAWEFWKRIPKCRPLRPDGKPNRPLTATTISIERAP